MVFAVSCDVHSTLEQARPDYNYQVETAQGFIESLSQASCRRSFTAVSDRIAPELPVYAESIAGCAKVRNYLPSGLNFDVRLMMKHTVAGDGKWDSERARKCLEFVDFTPNFYSLFELYDSFTVCADLIEGRVPLGGDCDSDYDCEGDAYCGADGSDMSCYRHVCKERVALGKDCSEGQACSPAGDLVDCYYDASGGQTICAIVKPIFADIGESCAGEIFDAETSTVEKTVCRDGLECRYSDKRCVERPGEGDPCTVEAGKALNGDVVYSDIRCSTGLICSSGFCQKPVIVKEENAACDELHLCDSFSELMCSDITDTCVKYQAREGLQACDSYRSGKPESFSRIHGMACPSNTECTYIDGDLKNYLCLPIKFVAEGDACYVDALYIAECKQGFHCEPQGNMQRVCAAAQMCKPPPIVGP